MKSKALYAKIAFTLFSLSMGTAAFADPFPTEPTLTQARNLHASRSADGYTISGELLSSNWCYATRFRRLGMSNAFAAEQFRRPWPKGAGIGPACVGQSWQSDSIAVTTQGHPRFARVRVEGDLMIKIPIAGVSYMQ